VLIALVVAPIYWFGPEFEGKYYPVMDIVELNRVTTPYGKSDQFTWYTVTLNTKRSCNLLPVIEWYITDFRNEKYRVAVTFDMQLTNQLPNQTIINNLGVDAKLKRFNSQTILFSHRCHSLWETHTLINIPYQ
jgi:hypothetical protein